MGYSVSGNANIIFFLFRSSPVLSRWEENSWSIMRHKWVLLTLSSCVLEYKMLGKKKSKYKYKKFWLFCGIEYLKGKVKKENQLLTIIHYFTYQQFA